MRVFNSDFRDVVSTHGPDPFPVHVLKRVDRPTTRILDDQVRRVDERESGINRARRGDFGPGLKQEMARFVPKFPVSGALSPRDKVMHNGYEKWPNNVVKCTSMRVGNQHGSSCGTCIKVCPWNKPFTPFHRLVMWTMRNVPPARRVGVWADDLLGYGKTEENCKWWYDLEDVDGNLQIPPKSRDIEFYEAQISNGGKDI